MKELDIRIRNGGDDAIAAVSELMPRWIPVTDRLPAEDEKVVVYTEEGTHVAAVDEDGVWYPSHGDGWMFPIVSHWMPLPAPPSDDK